MTTKPAQPTLVLTRGDVAQLLGEQECRMAVEEAFRRHGTGDAVAPALLGLHVEGGVFHIKAGLYDGIFVAKTNANFPGNPSRLALPTVQGVIQVFDARSGEVLALMDAIEITILRTAAATAVAAAHLAREDESVLTIAGCGTQGRAHLRALSAVRPLDEVRLWDIDPAASKLLAAELRERTSLRVEVAGTLAEAVPGSDMIVTCTPSHRFLDGLERVDPGTFVAGVGADNEDKRELPPSLLARSLVVVDVLEQCATMGDLHHAIAAGAMRREDVHAELGEIVAGRKAGRTSDSQTIVFDSTGMALQDAAAASIVVERARLTGRGNRISLA